MIYPPSPTTLVQVMLKKGYTVFGNKGDARYDLNLFGIRSSDMTPNAFDDYVGVFYWDGSKWLMYAFPATTDPGTFYRQNPMNVAGTSVLKPGQYRGAYKVGLHNGYKALQQAGNLTVYRDANRNATLELDEAKLQTGMFGINIHRANERKVSTQVDKWSAGCQVIADPTHFDFLMALAEKSAALNGNSFTYTLLTEKDFLS